MTSSGFPVRRTIAAGALACAAALIAGCSGSSSPAAAPTVKASSTAPATAPPSSQAGATSPATTPASASPTPTTTPGGPQPCATAALKAATGSGEGAAGSSYYAIDLTNNSSTSCTLYGYPGVSFVTGVGGSQIGPAATRNNAATPALITLAAGQTAHATLQVVDARNYPASLCKVVQAHWLRIYPPGQYSPLYVSFAALACGGSTSATRILSVQTVQPGAIGH